MRNNQQPSTAQNDLKQVPLQPRELDDRYPGSYFRIPGIPQPGKTTWTLIK